MAEIESNEENELTVPRFKIDSEITRQYRRFNAVGTELTVRLLPQQWVTIQMLYHIFKLA